MADKASRITEKTLVPLSIIGACAVILIGGVFWFSQVYSLSHANAQSISESKKDSKDYHKEVLKELKDINTRLSRIEGKLP